MSSSSQLLIYFVDAAAFGGGFGTLQVNSIAAAGGPPNSSTMATAWTPGAATFASSESSDMSYASVQGSGTFSTTLGPSNGVGTTKCFLTTIPLTGTFDGTTWTFSIEMIMTSVATSGNGNFRLRIYEAGNTTGSGAVELTTSTLVSTSFSMTSTSAQAVTVSWTPGPESFVAAGAFLYAAVACEVQAGAVTLSTTKISLRQDSLAADPGGFDCAITTAFFTPSSTLYFMCTGGGVGPGLDGGADQTYAGTTGWQYIEPFEATDNSYLASSAYDPASSGPAGQNGIAGSGTAFLFGNTDGSASIASYNVGTNSYVHFTTTLPVGYYGAGACAIISGVSYCVGGSSPTFAAVATVFSWANSQSISGSVNTSYQNLPEAVFSCMAVAVGGLIYHGGGDDGTNTFGHWYKWNPLTDVRTPLQSMPSGLSGAACVYLNGIIYLFGGYTNPVSGAPTQLVYAYNIAGNSWSTLNPFGTGSSGGAVSTAFASACFWNGSIYVGGGTIAGVYQYNVATDAYTLHSNQLVVSLSSIMFVAPAQQGAAAPSPTNDAIFFGCNM